MHPLRLFIGAVLIIMAVLLGIAVVNEQPLVIFAIAFVLLLIGFGHFVPPSTKQKAPEGG